MFTVKGFISQSSLKDNASTATSMFGEITSFCRTFAKDIKEYSSLDYSGLELLVFSAKSGTAGQVLTPLQRATLLEIGDYFFTMGATITPSWRILDVVSAFETRFAGKVSEVVCGNLLSDGFRRLPESITFRLTLTGLADTAVKLWLSNGAFEAQYDEFEIVVIPPVDSLDSLFLPAGQVETLLASRPMDRTMELIETAKAKMPPTVTVGQPVRWYNPAEAGSFLTMNWFAIVYGPKGNTTDLINAAIVSYILGNSSEPELSWKVVLPDLFRNTHFVVLPRWDLYAIPNRTSIAGIYSPMAGMEEGLNFAKTKLTAFTSTHVNMATVFTHHPYRSIGMVVVGGPDNRNNLFKISQVVGDYIGVESTHEDFNRQSELTKQWVTMMGNLLRAAENLTNALVVPSGMRVFARDGLTYVSQKLDNIEYMVAARLNYAPV